MFTFIIGLAVFGFFYYRTAQKKNLSPEATKTYVLRKLFVTGIGLAIGFFILGPILTTLPIIWSVLIVAGIIGTAYFLGRYIANSRSQEK